MRTTEDPAVRVEPRAPGPAPGRRRSTYVVGGVVAVLGLLVGLFLVIDERDDDVGVDTGTTATSTTVAPTTTGAPGPSTTSTPGAVDRSTAVWPFAGSGTRYSDPVEATRDFAVRFLRFTAPVVGPYRPGDGRSGEVEVRARPNGPATTVAVRQLTGDTSWSVLGAATGNVSLTRPAAGDEISSPVDVEGSAVAFEGNVQVEVREDGELAAIGSGYVTGGGDVMRPFAGSIAFDAPRAAYGALVLFTESAEDGQVWQASVVRVRLRPTDLDAASCGTYRSPRPQPGPAQMEIKVFFNCDADSGGGVSLHPVYRLVPKSPAVLRASLDALLRGPDASEQKAALGSWFSPATAGMLRSVTISDGHAVVDFADLRAVIPGASSSAGSARLLSQLDATVFQFRSVKSAEYRLLGSCEAFTEWLQFGGCEKRTWAEVARD